MSEPSDRRPKAALRPWLIAVLAYTLVIAVIVWLRAESTTDFRDFWNTARHFLQTGQLSRTLGVHNYLPFFPLFMLPFAQLPLRVAIELFTLISLAAFAAAVVLVETLRTGHWAGRLEAPAVVAVLLMLPYVTSCAVLGSVTLVLLLLVVASVALLTLRRDALAGVMLALAILIKLLPAALLVWLMLLRRWRAVATTLAVAAMLGLGLPLALLGPRETIRQHQRFYHTALVQHSSLKTLTTNKPPKANFSNNALPMVLRRLLSPLDARKGPEDPPVLVRIVDAPPAVRVAIYGILLAAVLGVSLWRTWPAGRGAGEVLPDDWLAALGIWCCVMLLASPLVWTHYLPLAYPALAAVCERALGPAGSRRAWARAGVVVWVLGIIGLAFPHARAAGAQIFSVLALWVALAAARDSENVARTAGRGEG